MTAGIPFGLCAQTEDLPDWNHFGVDFRLGLNIKAKFNHIGATSSLIPPQVGGVDRSYADGFVKVDSSGDRGGATWNWGYQNASQVSANGSLRMHVANTAGASSSENDEARPGFEASYARDLAHFGRGRWGLQLALGYTDVRVQDSQGLSGNVSLTTDAYSLAGITPPVAPYAGTFNGPGPVISDTTVRTTETVLEGARISGSRKLDVWLYDLRFGPYLELSLIDRLTWRAGAGLSLGLLDSTFSFSDTTITSAGTTQASGSGRSTQTPVGFYAETAFGFQVLRRTSIFAGAQFQYLGEPSQNVGDRSAQLDLRRSVFFFVGMQWQF